MTEDREHRVQQRAYAIWEAEGRPGGRDREHWERAERELAAAPISSGDDSSLASSIVKKPRKRTTTKTVAATTRSSKKKAAELRP
ncbi:MAG TPA: DUF2934 domain-containing protein [Stellaceae bacterium]|jgi:hypothetical protein|nr:DUF2934 domain-containing protein [Stellaceae bacterium]